MKVICINTRPITGKYDFLINLLREGETYTVVDVKSCVDKSGNRGYGYLLSETEAEQCLNRSVFNVARFIPLSEIDETELANQREQLQTV